MEPFVRAYIRACEAYGWEGGPEFKTEVVPMVNKAEKRHGQWSQPRLSFSASFMNIPRPLYLYIRQMHANRMGRLGAFLYRDRLDDTADNEEFAVAEAGQTLFQLAKNSVVDGTDYFTNIYALYTPGNDGEALDSEIEITVNGSPASDYVLDRDRGTVEFDTPLSGGEVIGWSGAFSWWVRFDNDRLPATIDNRSQGEYIVNTSVDLITVNPPRLVTSSGS